MISSATLEQPPSAVNLRRTGTLSDSTVTLTAPDFVIADHSQRLANVRSLREFGYALANTLCNQFRCEQVGVGIVRPRGVQVIAVSGFAQFKPENPGIVAMRQAMEECLDQGEVIVYPTSTDAAEFPIHRQWSMASGGSRVCCFPLYAGEDLIAVIGLRRPPHLPFSGEFLEQLGATTAPFGALLSLIDRANQPVFRHLARAMHRWLGSRRWATRVFCAALFLLATAWICFRSMTYRPLCESVVIATELQHMTAPFEARLEKIHVQAGDEVTAGDVLVEFDTGQLQLELEAIRAELARAEVSVRAAIEAGNVSAAALHQAHVRVLLARKSAVERRVRSAQLTAFSDGTIIQSDLDRRLGQVFSQGDLVLQFAPHAGWTLHVQVPENAAIYVEPGQVGCFASASRANAKVDFRILQVDGAAKVIDQHNVFVARAELQESPVWMRSGMQGVAQIKTIKRPVWWVTFHQILDWTRLRFWV